TRSGPPSRHDRLSSLATQCCLEQRVRTGGVLMARVLVIVPFPLGESGIANRAAQLEKVELGPDIEFDFRGVRAGPALLDSGHDTGLAEVALAEVGIRAQEEGYDAVCIDTMSDSGVNILR